jgi:mannose-6-phosphate isomerase-like protein (cupin superfamily)
MKSGLVTLKPGEAVGEHVTSGREEAIVILEGEAEVSVQGAPAFRSCAKSLVYIPPETPHDLRNCGKELLRYVYIVVPA